MKAGVQVRQSAPSTDCSLRGAAGPQHTVPALEAHRGESGTVDAAEEVLDLPLKNQTCSDQ
jgi:hypothetical protein